MKSEKSILFLMLMLLLAAAMPVCTYASAPDSSYFYISAGGKQLKVLIEDNAATAELMKMLGEGDLSINMSRYGGFEQVGDIGRSLPSEDKRITTKAGDVVLYSSDKLVVFYGSNTWEYTKIGKIQDMGKDELKELLSGSDLTITLSLDSFGEVPKTGVGDSVSRYHVMLLLLSASAVLWGCVLYMRRRNEA